MPDPVKVAKLSARPNLLVNADCIINQRGVGIATTNATYFSDQWLLSFAPTAQMSAQAVPFSTSSSPMQVGRNRIQIKCTGVKTTFAASDFYQIYQPMEALQSNILLKYGNASAQPSVLRFGFRGPAGTYGVSLNVVGGTGVTCWAGSFTIAPADANNDTIQVFPVPPVTFGTGWNAGTTYAMSLRFCLAAGSNYVGAMGWNTTQNVLVPAGFTNFLSSTSNVVEIFDPSWVPDPDNLGVDPGYNAYDYEAEIIRCKRYYQYPIQMTSSFYASAASMTHYATTVITPMRAGPTCNMTVAGALVNCSLAQVGATSPHTVYHQIQATAAGMVTVSGRIYELDAALV